MRRSQGRFQVIEYTGEDAAEVLMRIIAGGVDDEGPDEHEVESTTAVRSTGFQPNPMSEPEEGSEEGDSK